MPALSTEMATYVIKGHELMFWTHSTVPAYSRLDWSPIGVLQVAKTYKLNLFPLSTVWQTALPSTCPGLPDRPNHNHNH